VCVGGGVFVPFLAKLKKNEFLEWKPKLPIN
jgi:hypothetical protein